MRKILIVLTYILGMLPFYLSAQPTYSIQDLGTLANEKSSAYAINQAGSIAGKVTLKEEEFFFIWKKESGVQVLNFPSACGIPIINNLEQIAGVYWFKTSHWFASNYRSKHLFIWDDQHQLQDLGLPSGWEDQQLSDWQVGDLWDNHKLAVKGFNDRGEILVVNSCNNNKVTQIAVWKDHSFQKIPSTILDRAFAINNQSHVLGRTQCIENGIQFSFLCVYDLNTAEMIIKVPVKGVLIGTGLNDHDQLIGVMVDQASQGLKGFLWDSTNGMTYFNEFIPLAINNKGNVLGYQMEDSKKIPCVWQKGKFFNLNQELNLSYDFNHGWISVTSLYAINDLGQIVGEGFNGDSKHAFLINPLELD